MKYYFAHPISIYNTPKEHVLIDMILKTPFLSNPMILNPNSDYHESQYKIKGMDYFLTLVDECDALIIYPFEDGTIGAGIVKEALRAVDKGKRIYQIDPNTFKMVEVFKLKNCLSVDDTRAKLKEIKNLNIGVEYYLAHEVGLEPNDETLIYIIKGENLINNGHNKITVSNKRLCLHIKLDVSEDALNMERIISPKGIFEVMDWHDEKTLSTFFRKID